MFSAIISVATFLVQLVVFSCIDVLVGPDLRCDMFSALCCTAYREVFTWYFTALLDGYMSSSNVVLKHMLSVCLGSSREVLQTRTFSTLCDTNVVRCKAM